MDKFEIIAKTLFGFENVLANELKNIGAEDIRPLNRAVSYKGDNSILYKSNYLLRTALRIIKPIMRFSVLNEKQLYERVKKMKWENYLSLNQTFAVDCVLNSEVFNHSQYIALKTKDAIVDRFRNKVGSRPSVNTENPDIRINVHVSNTSITISLDSSGNSLDKRGYKLSSAKAPLSEVLAAGIILLSEWDCESTFIDGMCGSGTIPIEAALIARNIPAGSFRKFGFENWNDFDKDLWSKIKNDADELIKDYSKKIIAYDINKFSIMSSKENAVRAGVDDLISFEKNNFFETSYNSEKAIIIMNPPYGERMDDEEEDMAVLYEKIGSHLKHSYNGCDAWIFSGNLDAIKLIGLKPSKKIKLFNGAIECKLHKYELYKGSKK